MAMMKKIEDDDNQLGACNNKAGFHALKKEHKEGECTSIAHDQDAKESTRND
jgi:hypothetical protein